MSVTETIMRYHLIISKLKKHPASLNEINDFLERESQFRGYDLVRDKRTFIRDLDAIRSIYDIDIRYNFKKAVYEIIQDEQNDKSLRMVEALDLFNALKISENITNVIHFEKRRPIGSEHLNGLLHAIQNKVKIQFSYQKYWEDLPEIRNVEPHALKEFKNRWYLLAMDLNREELRIFALDRMSNLIISNRKFQHKTIVDVNNFFKNCFGVIAPEDEQVEEVILSIDAFQGKYIKSLPLHETQEVLIDDENEVRIRLNIYLTFDFIMEVLSYGDRVKVIQPDNLIEQIKNIYSKSIEKYL
ncbi:MAG: WYL domain-containing protein [Candidatus Delongbacteria bacterium]|nr:WYL domain-containing protein [Candidatus Delongbacteria bacterium]